MTRRPGLSAAAWAFAFLLMACLHTAMPGQGRAQETVPSQKALQDKIRAWLEPRLRQPSTYQPIKWSKVVSHPEGEGPYAYSIRHTYRVLTLDDKYLYVDRIFSFDRDGVIIGDDIIAPGGDVRKTRWRP